MNDYDNFNSVFFKAVYNAVIAENLFTEHRIIIFRHNPTQETRLLVQ
jgi:hypothetical protein